MNTRDLTDLAKVAAKSEEANWPPNRTLQDPSKTRPQTDRTRSRTEYCLIPYPLPSHNHHHNHNSNITITSIPITSITLTIHSRKKSDHAIEGF